MGLAGPKNKTKISHDPNNTKWARSTSGFGHRIMSAQGWTPGNRLGAKDAAHAEHLTSASISHIKVTIKDDNLGLGARLGREGQPTGLDAFKGLLGRLNGKSDEELNREQRKRDDVQLARYVALKFQEVRFVRGGLLTQEKLERLPPTPEEEQAGNQKSESSPSDSDSADNTESATDKPSKSKSKKSKSSKKSRSKPDEADSSSSVSEKKKKKKSKKRKADGDDEESESSAKRRASTPDEKPSSESQPVIPTVQAAPLGERRPMGRAVFRGRHIAQKKRALMDDKSLNEIFMVKA